MRHRGYGANELIPRWKLYTYTPEDAALAQFAGARLAEQKQRELEADLERVLHYQMFGRVLPRAPDPDDTQLQERGQVRDDVPANQPTEGSDHREEE